MATAGLAASRHPHHTGGVRFKTGRCRNHDELRRFNGLSYQHDDGPQRIAISLLEFTEWLPKQRRVSSSYLHEEKSPVIVQPRKVTVQLFGEKGLPFVYLKRVAHPFSTPFHSPDKIKE
jgi:hypothetical protein